MVTTHKMEGAVNNNAHNRIEKPWTQRHCRVRDSGFRKHNKENWRKAANGTGWMSTGRKRNGAYFRSSFLIKDEKENKPIFNHQNWEVQRIRSCIKPRDTSGKQLITQEGVEKSNIVKGRSWRQNTQILIMALIVWSLTSGPLSCNKCGLKIWVN